MCLLTSFLIFGTCRLHHDVIISQGFQNYLIFLHIQRCHLGSWDTFVQRLRLSRGLHLPVDKGRDGACDQGLLCLHFRTREAKYAHLWARQIRSVCERAERVLHVATLGLRVHHSFGGPWISWNPSKTSDPGYSRMI